MIRDLSSRGQLLFTRKKQVLFKLLNRDLNDKKSFATFLRDKNGVIRFPAYFDNFTEALEDAEEFLILYRREEPRIKMIITEKNKVICIVE